MTNRQALFLLLTFLAGCFLLYPGLDVQSMLATGDHGRDLYAFQQTLRGDIPYRDYWWVYGPLMPYYYAFAFQWLGVNILSVLFAESVLILASGVLFYLILTKLIPSSFLSFLGAVWFLLFNENFFITYNHAGGVVLILFVTWCLFSYLKDPETVYLWTALPALTLLMFVKINFGFCTLVSFLLSVLVIDYVHHKHLSASKINFYLAVLMVLPAFTFMVYALLLKDLPVYAIRQCLPYLQSDHPYHAWITTPAQMLIKAIFTNAASNLTNLGFTGLILVSLMRIIRMARKGSTGPKIKETIFLGLGILAFFYLTHLHEYLFSGVLYRSFWAKPFSFLLIFLILGTAAKGFSWQIKFLIIFAILAIITNTTQDKIATIAKLKNPHHYLSLEKGKIFVGNPPQWIQTVTQTTQFFQENLKPGEMFFAMPYDPLYYFLTNKSSPTRQLIFFDHINIPPEQEEKIIQDLENKQIRWVVLSSRIKSDETGLGTFGETYCPLLGKYLTENFETVETFGDWTNSPGWAWNHGVKILRKK